MDGLRALLHRRDFFAGLLMCMIGAGAIVEGSKYTVGSLVRMGPGYFPVALGIVLIFVGLLIVVTSSGDDDDGREFATPDLRGSICIVLGTVAFILLAERAGLLAAIFGCVFISALGDRNATLKGAVVLGVVACLFGVALFSVLLGLSLPLVVMP